MGGYPCQGGLSPSLARSRWGCTLARDGVTLIQRWGTPLPRIGQQMEYLIRGGRYASCVHAGGLSCLFMLFKAALQLHCKVNSVIVSVVSKFKNNTQLFLKSMCYSSFYIFCCFTIFDTSAYTHIKVEQNVSPIQPYLKWNRFLLIYLLFYFKLISVGLTFARSLNISCDCVDFRSCGKYSNWKLQSGWIQWIKITLSP